jgi:site-specific DNA-methyltransferase (adenine-specific)
VTDLRLGRWQDALADVDQVDAVISDPPYGERTHAKQEHGRHLNGTGTAWVSARGIGYAAWSAEDVADFATALERAGRYVFAPLACVQRGMNVRLAGDGPSSWTVWLVVSRPSSKAWATWGTLPGAYVGTAVDPGEQLSDKAKRAVAGGKPLWLMRAIVRDYTRPGDLVCDPCAGGATTLLAAAMEGRRAVGAEMDPVTFEKASKRLAQGYTPDLFTAASP